MFIGCLSMTAKLKEPAEATFYPLQKAYTYEDDDFKVIVMPYEKTNFYGTFSIQNKTSQMAEFVWAKAAYVDLNGQTNRVYRPDTKVIHSDLAPASAAIAPNATYSNILIVETKPGEYGAADIPREYEMSNWACLTSVFYGIPPLLEYHFWKGKAKKWSGKTYSIYFPIDIGGNEQLIAFTFELIPSHQVVSGQAISARATYTIVYDISLHAVERPADAKRRYGEQTITTIEEEGIQKYFFEDEMVKILWLPTASDINFTLTNKTNHSIKIIWDEAAFVDEEGHSHRIIHSGVKFIDKNNPQPPSVIVRNATISDLILSADNIHYAEGWRKEPIFQTKVFDTTQSIEQKAKTYIGKTYQVLLPLEIEGVTNEYIFTFQVDSIEIK